MTANIPIEPCPCKCGAEPTVLIDAFLTRHSVVTRPKTWEVACPKCHHCAYSHHEHYTRDAAILNWNANVCRWHEREAAPDKLIHDLEHSDDIEQVALHRRIQEALARVLRKLDG